MFWRIIFLVLSLILLKMFLFFWKLMNLRKKETLHQDSMLKLLIYDKIQHIDRTSIITDNAMHPYILRFVYENIRPSKRSIQRYQREYCHYFEVLLQTILKKAFDEGFTNLITCYWWNHPKKHTIPTTTQSPKKKPKYYSITTKDTQLVLKASKTP